MNTIDQTNIDSLDELKTVLGLSNVDENISLKELSELNNDFMSSLCIVLNKFQSDIKQESESKENFLKNMKTRTLSVAKDNLFDSYSAYLKSEDFSKIDLKIKEKSPSKFLEMFTGLEEEKNESERKTISENKKIGFSQDFCKTIQDTFVPENKQGKNQSHSSSSLNSNQNSNANTGTNFREDKFYAGQNNYKKKNQNYNNKNNNTVNNRYKENNFKNKENVAQQSVINIPRNQEIQNQDQNKKNNQITYQNNNNNQSNQQSNSVNQIFNIRSQELVEIVKIPLQNDMRQMPNNYQMNNNINSNNYRNNNNNNNNRNMNENRKTSNYNSIYYDQQTDDYNHQYTDYDQNGNYYKKKSYNNGTTYNGQAYKKNKNKY